jgi:hypothetical protein
MQSVAAAAMSAAADRSALTTSKVGALTPTVPALPVKNFSKV